jgi:molybdate transport system substrate-binding protein
MEEIVVKFKENTVIEVTPIYGGAGVLFSQIMLSKQGDLFIVPSTDIMDKATSKGLVTSKSIREFTYVVPSINVQKGNPLNIKGLKDLTQPGVKIAIGNPETVYIGGVAVEIIEMNLTPDEKASLRKNIMTYGKNLSQLTSLLVLKQVDAIIGFTYLSGWYPEKVETVKFKPNEVARIGAGQAGIFAYSANKNEAQEFIDFLVTDDVQKIFKKYHYFVNVDEAFNAVEKKKPVGGKYVVPKEWIKK